MEPLGAEHPVAVEPQDDEQVVPLMRPEDIIIPVMGMTGAGKSTFISHCTREPAIQIGHGLSSCTSRVSVYSMRHCGRLIHLIDTPGFDDTGRNDQETLQQLAFWLAVAYQNGLKINGIIYLHRITDLRVQGAAMQSLNVLKKLCGDDNFHAIVLATTKWDDIGPNQISKARSRQRELCEKERFWGDIMRGGGKAVSLQSLENDSLEIITDLANRDRKITLAFQRQLFDDKRQLYQTDAGRVVFESISEQVDIEESRLEETKSSLEEQVQYQNSQERMQLEQMKQQIEQSIKSREKNLASLRVTAEELQVAWTKQLQHELKNGEPWSLDTPKRDSTELKYSSVWTKPAVIAEDVLHRRVRTSVERREGPGRLTALSALGTVLGAGQLIAAMACTIM